MTDEKIRERERDWKDAGSIDAHAARLAAQLRAGQLDEERVRLAALLGCPAADQALGGRRPGHLDSDQSLSAWLRATGPWPGDAAVAAVLGIAELLAERASPEEAGITRPVLIETRRCLHDPCQENADAVDLLVEALWSKAGDPEGERRKAVTVLTGLAGRRARDFALGRAPKRGWLNAVDVTASHATQYESEADIRRVVRHEAIRRLLGEGEPPSTTAHSPVPARPPLDAALAQLQSTLRWVDAHLSSYQRLRDEEPELAEQELRYLNSEVRDARREAERLGEILRLWDAAAGASDHE